MFNRSNFKTIDYNLNPKDDVNYENENFLNLFQPKKQKQLYDLAISSVKSTISIEGWEQIIELFPSHTISFSPEFLRAKTAIEDMLNTKTIYIGGGHYYFWERVLNRPDKVVKIKHADPRELILAKYFRNSFLATKVAFFNQIYDLCEATNIDFSKVSTLITEDSRIGQSHTEVTTERGFGGHCFPKDTQAIIETGHREGVDLSLIREAIRYNNNIRKGDT